MSRYKELWQRAQGKPWLASLTDAETAELKYMEDKASIDLT